MISLPSKSSFSSVHHDVRHRCLRTTLGVEQGFLAFAGLYCLLARAQVEPVNEASAGEYGSAEQRPSPAKKPVPLVGEQVQVGREEGEDKCSCEYDGATK